MRPLEFPRPVALAADDALSGLDRHITRPVPLFYRVADHTALFHRGMHMRPFRMVGVTLQAIGISFHPGRVGASPPKILIQQAQGSQI